jgi:RNA-directed DNA polymerase
VLSKGLRSGFIDRGPLFATTSGVPQGGIDSPVLSHMVLDGLEAVVHSGSWPRRVPHINDGRWADDCIVTAHSRQVLEDTVLPRINAFLAPRGVRLSPTKTVITPMAQGVDFVGQTRRTYERPNGQRGTLQMTPSKVSFQARKARVNALCTHAAGHTPAPLIDTLNPVRRGWANDHRHVICGETFATLANFGWRRLYRWAKQRHPNKTGYGIAKRDFPHHPGESWRFTDPDTGKPIIRVREVVKPPRHVKVKGDANPFEPAGEAYVQHRDRPWARQASSRFRAKVLRQQDGRCLVCRQVIPCEEALERHHREGDHQHHRLMNLALLHPTCHRQVHHAPDSKPHAPRSLQGVAHA